LKTIIEIVDRLSDFGDDHVAGARWLKDNFDTFSEQSKDQVYQVIMARWDEFPKEAQDILVWLSFKCEAGRKRVGENIERAASKLPEGKLKRDLIGDSEAPPKEEKKSRVWTTCVKYKDKMRPTLRDEVASAATEEVARKFLTDHFKELPQEMQDELTMVFFEEALVKKNEEDRKELARQQKFLEAAKRFEATETERNPERRKQNFLEFVKRFIEKEGPIKLPH